MMMNFILHNSIPINMYLMVKITLLNTKSNIASISSNFSIRISIGCNLEIHTSNVIKNKDLHIKYNKKLAIKMYILST